MKAIKSVGVALLLNIIAAMIFESYKQFWLSVFDNIGNGLSWFWKTCMMYKIPIWFVLLIVLTVAIVLMIALRYSFLKSLKPLEDTIAKPEHYNYTRDKFGKYYWTWSWVNQGVAALGPVCPTCNNLAMINRFRTDRIDGATYATCSFCRLQEQPSDVIVNQNEFDVRAEIYRRVEKGDYKDA